MCKTETGDMWAFFSALLCAMAAKLRTAQWFGQTLRDFHETGNDQRIGSLKQTDGHW